MIARESPTLAFVRRAETGPRQWLPAARRDVGGYKSALYLDKTLSARICGAEQAPCVSAFLDGLHSDGVFGVGRSRMGRHVSDDGAEDTFRMTEVHDSGARMMFRILLDLFSSVDVKAMRGGDGCDVAATTSLVSATPEPVAVQFSHT